MRMETRPPMLRPLFASLLICVAAGAVEAKKKPAPAASTPSACSDFYQNVNQAWLSAHPLPSGLPSYSRWNELNISAQQRLRDLLTSKGPAASGPATRLLADLVASSADAAAMDAGVRTSAAPLLQQVESIRKPRDITKVIASLHAAGVPVLFGFDALRDPETGQPRASFYPAGLGLPEAGYYAANTPELKPGVDAYRAYLAAQLKFAGVAEAKAEEQAGQAFDLEQSLAKAMAEDGREAYAPAALGKAYSNLYLPDLMQSVGWAPTNVTVLRPVFFHSLDKQLARPNVAQWKAYLRAQIMHSLAPARGTDPRLAYLAALRIAGDASLDRVDRLSLLALAEGSDLSSAAFAEAYLPDAAQRKALAIAEAVRAAMGRAIDRASWLSESGKTASRTKLAAMRLSIGEPSEPIDFGNLRFERANLAANLLALRRWNLGRSLARLNSAVWPAPVYRWQPVIGYQPSQNRLVVSAAVLSAPVFEGKSSATDYGALGALVGQQMSLAFADYTDADGRALAARQAGLVDQYAAYAATPTTKVNATRMLRQNAADLAGIELSWDAFNAQGAADAEAKKAFFRAWASTWARQDNANALAEAQQTGAFSPARWRVNGPLVNTPAFATTFACKPGQAMFKAAKDQQAIWR